MADAASDDVATEPAPDASALADRFVASSLEAAIAPLAPLTLAVSATPPAAIVPTDPGTRPASSPASTSPHAPLSLSGRDERPEHEARLAGIAAAVARNPLAVRREVEALVPELRQRLDRVIDRMEQEYGYTVEVVETVRTQERQDALFAQGRTTEGPIVTWTRNSRHLGGAAADVASPAAPTRGVVSPSAIACGSPSACDVADGPPSVARGARERRVRPLSPLFDASCTAFASAVRNSRPCASVGAGSLPWRALGGSADGRTIGMGRLMVSPGAGCGARPC